MLISSFITIPQRVMEIYCHIFFGMLAVKFIKVPFEKGIVYQNSFNTFLSGVSLDDTGQFLCKSDKGPRRSSKKQASQKIQNGRNILMKENDIIGLEPRNRRKKNFISRTHSSKVININVRANLDSGTRVLETPSLLS